MIAVRSVLHRTPTTRRQCPRRGFRLSSQGRARNGHEWLARPFWSAGRAGGGGGCLGDVVRHRWNIPISGFGKRGCVAMPGCRRAVYWISGCEWRPSLAECWREGQQRSVFCRGTASHQPSCAITSPRCRRQFPGRRGGTRRGADVFGARRRGLMRDSPGAGSSRAGGSIGRSWHPGPSGCTLLHAARPGPPAGVSCAHLTGPRQQIRN
jgi:hypothetical protein